MFLNHTADKTGFASQSRHTKTFERSEREMKLSNSNKGIRILTDYNVLCGGSECFVA
jgi:hypothetical protein